MITFAKESAYRWQYYAVVIPQPCSMKSLGQSGINDNILIHAFSFHGYEGAIGQMLMRIQQRIGEILKFDDGQFQIDKSALPDGYFEPDVPTPAEPLASLPSSQDMLVSQHEDAPESRHEPVEEEVKRKDEAEQKIEAGFRALTNSMRANRPEDQQDAAGPSSTELPEAGQRTRMEPRRLRHCGAGSPGGGTNEYEQSDLETDFTPSVSAASDTTTTLGLDLEGGGAVEAAANAAESPVETAAEVNRNIIRDEVSLVLGRIFAGLAEQVGGSSFGG